MLTGATARSSNGQSKCDKGPRHLPHMFVDCWVTKMLKLLHTYGYTANNDTSISKVLSNQILKIHKQRTAHPSHAKGDTRRNRASKHTCHKIHKSAKFKEGSGFHRNFSTESKPSAKHFLSATAPTASVSPSHFNFHFEDLTATAWDCPHFGLHQNLKVAGKASQFCDDLLH